MYKHQIPMWIVTGLFGFLGLGTLMLVAWSRRVEGLVPALATIGVAISLCPKVPLRGYERWGLTMLLLIFT